MSVIKSCALDNCTEIILAAALKNQYIFGCGTYHYYPILRINYGGSLLKQIHLTSALLHEQY